MRAHSGCEQVVLGIDAAWTTKNPSGVALIAGTGSKWRLCASSDSYSAFTGLPAVGGQPCPASILRSAEERTGQRIDLVTIDMPLAHGPIIARRLSDDAVPRQYGARWCGTHSPDAKRPGIISDNLTKDFAAEGYPLKTRTIETPSLIEVYPHPALLELMSASMRLPYKVGKQRIYWKEVSPAERRQRLVEQWTAIVDAIDARIAGIRTGLEIPLADAPIRALKSFEDRLDAVICALVGACALTGHAKPWGDDHSAIWIPSSGLGPG